VIRYPLARNGIVQTVQGEGTLLGTPMVFVRLGGCSIGCSQCDTDYRTVEHLTVAEIQSRVRSVRGDAEWIAVTGGEPADYDLCELLEGMRLCGRVMLATSGHKHLGGAGSLCDFISVSPHGTPDDLKVSGATQINLVPLLNGLRLDDWEIFSGTKFQHRWVTPIFSNLVETAECRAFVERHRGWRLGVQAQNVWGVW